MKEIQDWENNGYLFYFDKLLWNVTYYHVYIFIQ